jgi:hypothetical protein
MLQSASVSGEQVLLPSDQKTVGEGPAGQAPPQHKSWSEKFVRSAGRLVQDAIALPDQISSPGHIFKKKVGAAAKVQQVAGGSAKAAAGTLRIRPSRSSALTGKVLRGNLPGLNADLLQTVQITPPAPQAPTPHPLPPTHPPQPTHPSKFNIL